MEQWPDYSPIENMRVWGTASHMISFGPGGEQIWEWFSDDIFDAWRDFVCDLDSHGLKAWSSAFDWVVGLGVAPFKGDSLSTMHLVNRLAEVGLCEEPTAAELGLWISRHADRGAYAGLQDVGFSQLESAQHVILAFSTFHNYVRRKLSVEQREAMHFTTITSENFLCKIVRVRRLIRLLKLEATFEGLMVKFLAQDGEVSVHDHFDLAVFLASADVFNVIPHFNDYVDTENIE